MLHREAKAVESVYASYLCGVPQCRMQHELEVLLCDGRGSLLSLDFTSENVIRYPSHVALYLVPYGARRPSHHPSVTRR